MPKQPSDNSEPDDRGNPPTDPNEFGKWLVDRATEKDDDSSDADAPIAKD